MTQPEPTSLLQSLPIGNLEIHDRLKKLVSTYVIATAAIEVGRKIYRSARARLMYTIAVTSGDEIYDALHERILAMIPEQRRRSIIVRGTRNTRDFQPVSVDDDGPTVRLAQLYDGTREQTIELDNHRVRVTIEREDPGVLSLLRDSDFPRRERIVFTAQGIGARDAVIVYLADIADSLNKRDAPRFFLATRWGDWIRRDDLTPRNLDTVILAAGQKEALCDDLHAFLNQRREYERLGLPYHRGYLFHGPPGTGKTSLAQALATHFGLDIYYVPLSDLEKDASLLRLVTQVRPGSILLLEDIDILHAAASRDDSAGLSLSGLLNALDGVSTPAGLITIMTTNHPGVLDEALIRPGRVDRSEPIGFLTDEQLGRLADTFDADAKFDLPSVTGRNVAPAAIAEVLKRHLGDSRWERRRAIATFLRR